jgi:arginase family enzyme
MGWCWREMAATIPGFEPVEDRSVFLLGTRDIDPLEQNLLDRSAVRVLSPETLGQNGLDRDLAPLRDHAAYIHCDLDTLDLAEGTGEPVPRPRRPDPGRGHPARDLPERADPGGGGGVIS